METAIKIWWATIMDSSSDFMLISLSRKIFLKILTKAFFMKIEEEILIKMTFTSKERLSEEGLSSTKSIRQIHREAIVEFFQAVKFYLEEQRFENMQDPGDNNSCPNHFHSPPFIMLLRNLALIKTDKGQKKISKVHLESDGVYLKLSKLIRGERKSLEPESKNE